MMLSCSEEFLSIATDTIRNVRAKIEVTWVDSLLDSSIVVSSNGENNVSVKNHVADEKKTTPFKYFLLDGTFVADGSYHPFPGTDFFRNLYQVGWYGNKLCNSFGVFTPTYPTLTVEFAVRPISSITVLGEPTLNEFPVNFQLQFYNEAVLLGSVSVTNNTELEFKQFVGYTEVTKINLVITKWSAPDTICKITELYSSISQTYEGDDIVSLSLLEEREVRQGSLPVGNIASRELYVELQNVKLADGTTDQFFPGNTASAYHEVMLPNRRIKAWLGFELADGSIEYLLMGTFWSGDWEIKNDSFSVSTTCYDRLYQLRQKKFPLCPLYENTTLYELLDTILTYAKNYFPMPELQWNIDSQLLNFPVEKAWFDNKSYADIVRDISEAAVGTAYMSKDDVLIVESYKANIVTDDYDLEIDSDNYFSKDQPSNIKELKNTVVVETQPLIAQEETSVLYTSNEAINIGGSETTDEITIKYSDKPVIDASITFIEYGSLSLTLETVDYYADGAVLTVKNNSVSAGSFKIQVEGLKLEVNGSERISSENSSSVLSNGILEYSFPINGLIQTRETAQLIASVLVDSYSEIRNDIMLEWRGNPALELGDVFRCDEYSRDEIETLANFIVYKSKLDFDGSLRGQLYGRKVTQEDNVSIFLQDDDNAYIEPYKFQVDDNAVLEIQDQG